jgi:HK97 gp10 family phage protein
VKQLVKVKVNVDVAVKQLKGNMKGFLQDVGAFLEDKMDEYVAVDTGNLQSSNTHVVEENSVVVGNDEDYAVFQEVGTSKMAAHPFVEPAAMNHLDEIEEIAKETIARGLK